MKCKVLHLPTGQYMYWDTDFPSSYEYFYSQYEVDYRYGRDKSYLNIFKSKADALKYIRCWVKHDDLTAFEWDTEGTEIPILVKHFLMVEAEDV